MNVWDNYFTLDNTIFSQPKVKTKSDMHSVHEGVKKLFSENGTQYIWAKFYEIDRFKKGEVKPEQAEKFLNYKQLIENWTFKEVYKFQKTEFSMMSFYKALVHSFQTADENTINTLALTFPKATEEVLEYNRKNGLTLQDNKILRCFTRGLGLQYDFDSNSGYKPRSEKAQKAEAAMREYANKHAQTTQYKANSPAQSQNKSGKNYTQNYAQTTQYKAGSPAQNQNKPENKNNYTQNKGGFAKKSEANFVRASEHNDDERVVRARDVYAVELQKLFRQVPENFKELDAGEKYLLKSQFSTGIKEAVKQLISYNNLNLQTVMQEVVLPALTTFSKKEIDIFNEFSNKQEKMKVNSAFLKGNLWRKINEVKDPELRQGVYEYLGNKIELEDTPENIYQSVFTTLSMITKDEQKFKERLKFLNTVIPNVQNMSCYIRIKDLDNGKKQVELASYTELLQANSEGGFQATSIKDLLLKFNNPMWNETLSLNLTLDDLEKAMARSEKNSYSR